MSALNNFYADRIIAFIEKYAPYIFQKAKKISNNPRQIIKSFILKHMEFQTIVVLWDKGEIIGVCNFNIYNDVADIQDCVIRPDFRFKGVLKQMTFKAIQRWPLLKKLKFSRQEKVRKESREISISKLLKIPALA